MAPPKMTAALLASEWVAHHACEDAWEKMDELLQSEPERVWRLIQVMVGVAPDYGVLSAVAAGPVEDLIYRHGEQFMPRIEERARKDERLRICLGATYSTFAPELAALIEAEKGDVRDLPPNEVDPATTEELALLVRWLRYSDTGWAPDLLSEMTKVDAAGAWDVLRVLCVFADDDERIRETVFDDTFEPFMRHHFGEFREQLLAMGRKSHAFRQWAKDRRKSPIDDEGEWAGFLSGLSAT